MLAAKSVLTCLSLLALSGVALAAGDPPPGGTRTGNTVDRIVIFGDSLSDVGNMYASSFQFVPPHQSYWQGRFSDGFVWVDYLAQSLGVSAYTPSFIINRSVGGATAYPYPPEAKALITDNIWQVRENIGRLSAILMSHLDYQIDDFDDENDFRGSDLVVIWLGANDMYWVGDATDSSLTPEVISNRATSNIEAAIQRIANRGVRNFIIFGNPDLNMTPAFNKPDPKDPKKAELAPKRSEQAAMFIRDLRAIVGRFAKHVNITFVDVDDMFRTVLMPNAAKFGFTNTTDAIYTGPSLNIPTTPQMEFSVHRSGDSTNVFWDIIHPSTKTHAILADYIRERVIKPTFVLRPPTARCTYVEVSNLAALVLRISIDSDSADCGLDPDDTLWLAAGQKWLFAVPSDANIKFSPLLLGGATVAAERQEAAYSTKYATAPLKVQIPVLQRITCRNNTTSITCASGT